MKIFYIVSFVHSFVMFLCLGEVLCLAGLQIGPVCFATFYCSQFLWLKKKKDWHFHMVQCC